MPPGAPPPRPDRFWSNVAIIAIIAATAGWTTVGALILTRPSEGSAATTSGEPIESDIAFEEESLEPEDVERHDAPDLEALLPSEWDGTPLSVMSFVGEDIVAETEWGLAFADFIEAEGKDITDLAVADAADPTSSIDLFVSVFRLEGEDAATVIEGLTTAASLSTVDAENPESGFKTSEIQLGGTTVTKGTFADALPDEVASYFLAGDGVVYDIETADEQLAADVIASLQVKPDEPSPS
jgi:hypothetical protein